MVCLTRLYCSHCSFFRLDKRLENVPSAASVLILSTPYTTVLANAFTPYSVATGKINDEDMRAQIYFCKCTFSVLNECAANIRQKGRQMQDFFSLTKRFISEKKASYCCRNLNGNGEKSFP